MSDANLLSRLRRKITLILGREGLPFSPADMTGEDKMAEKWGDFAEERATETDAKREYMMDHPLVEKYVYDSYLDGKDPFKYASRHFPRMPLEFGLEIGCGSGYLSIGLVKGAICKQIDAFDVSGKAMVV